MSNGTPAAEGTFPVRQGSDAAGALRAARALHAVRLLHTVVWALFATAIALIPVAAWLGAWRLATALIALVSVECLVLLLNRMRCPLTAVAARYTDDRSDNFDIYLPLWLARYNKHIFGTLFLVGLAVALYRLAA
jgi:hypothetical protein